MALKLCAQVDIIINFNMGKAILKFYEAFLITLLVEISKHADSLKGFVERHFYYCGTLKKAFRIKTPSEINTSTTSGHPL